MINWNALTTKERTALVRFYLIEKHWSYDEIATYLGVTRNTIAGLCYRQKLKAAKPEPRKITAVNNLPALAPPSSISIVVPLTHKPARKGVVDPVVKRLKATRLKHNPTSIAQRLTGRAIDMDTLFERDPKPLKRDAWQPLAGVDPTDVVAASHWHCRWPVSEDNLTWCGGAVKTGSVYCPTHHAMAYLPPSPPRSKKRSKEPHGASSRS